MFIVLVFQPESDEMERRGADRHCVPQKHIHKTLGDVWLISAACEFDMSGLTPVTVQNSASEILAWLKENCNLQQVEGLENGFE